MLGFRVAGYVVSWQLFKVDIAGTFNMNIAQIAKQLEQTGYIILDHSLPDALLTALRGRCDDSESNDHGKNADNETCRDRSLTPVPPLPVGEGYDSSLREFHVNHFRAANIGRGADKQQLNSIRGDVISWLEDNNEIDRAYLALMETLRLGLNEALYLGLFDYECHYAIYHAGKGYAKHSDVLRGRKNRVLTTVLYLNQDWQADFGGELIVYEAGGNEVIATVAPEFGTMIIFLSELFPHEVLISHNTRRSIAGWFHVS
jgi:SM-20-related protein